MNRKGAKDAKEMARRVFLGLGSNVGEREANLREAIARLRGAEGVTFLRQSRVYQTAPIGVTDQPEFLNMVVEVEVAGTPPPLPPPRTRRGGDDAGGMTARELLTLVKGIETEVGRKQRERWGPREIDIDVLLFGDEQIVEDDFEVPHPRMWERAFVLVPLAELEPDMKTPRGETVAEVAARLGREQGVRPLTDSGTRGGGVAGRRWSRKVWDWLAFLPLAAVMGGPVVGTFLGAMMGPFAARWNMTFVAILAVAGLVWMGLSLASLIGVAWYVDPMPDRMAAGRRLLILMAAPVVLWAWSQPLPLVDNALQGLHARGFRRAITRTVELSALQTDALRMIDAQNRRDEELKVKWPSLASDPRVPGSIRRLRPEWLVVVPAHGSEPGYVDISWMPGIFYICGLRVGSPQFTPGTSSGYEKWAPGIYAYERNED